MSALLSDVELSVLTAVIARGELLTNRDAQRLRGHIEALGEKYAAAVALAEAQVAHSASVDASWYTPQAKQERLLRSNREDALANYRATR